MDLMKLGKIDYMLRGDGSILAIEWRGGAVCFAGGGQRNAEYLKNIAEWFTVGVKDFQLNTVKQGDYIEASELDTEQKYNDAVDVFELFGFSPYLNCDMDVAEFILTASKDGCGLIADSDGDLVIDYNYELDKLGKKRKLTYPQLMAIGKLKRLEVERDNALIDAVENTSILSDALNENHSELPNSSDAVNKPSHYQFFEGVEVIEIIASSMTREQFKGYCLGNRIKYRLRAGKKDELEQEIAKSDKYVELYDECKHLCKK